MIVCKCFDEKFNEKKEKKTKINKLQLSMPIVENKLYQNEKKRKEKQMKFKKWTEQNE